MAMAYRRAVRVALALRAHDIVDLLLQQLGQHPEPGRDAQRQQPLLRCPNQRAQRLLHPGGQHGLLSDRGLRDRYGLLHGGSSFDLWRITANAPNRNGRGGGTAVCKFYELRDNLGIVAWYAGELNEARRQAEHATSLIHEAESERGELADLQALIAHAAGTWEQHTEWQLAEVWHVPELAGRVFDVYTCVTEYVLHAGEPYPRLADFARRLREHAHTGGALRGEAFSTTLLGEIELLTGDLQAARTHLLEAATLSRKAGAIGGEALSRTRLGEALIHLGERSAAREQLDEALALAHASALADHLLFIVQGPLLRVPEDPADALALVDSAEALLDATSKCLFCPIDYYLAAATACARAGDTTRAHAFLARVEATAGLWNGGPWAPAAAEARGAVLAADGDTEAATHALRRAIAGYATAGQRLNEDRARRLLNEHLVSARVAH